MRDQLQGRIKPSWCPRGTVVEWRAHSAGVPMVTGSNPCYGKDLFPGPRASLSPPRVPNTS